MTEAKPGEETATNSIENMGPSNGQKRLLQAGQRAQNDQKRHTRKKSWRQTSLDKTTINCQQLWKDIKRRQTNPRFMSQNL